MRVSPVSDVVAKMHPLADLASFDYALQWVQDLSNVRPLVEGVEVEVEGIHVIERVVDEDDDARRSVVNATVLVRRRTAHPGRVGQRIII